MLEHFFRYLFAKLVWVGGGFIAIQALWLPHSEVAITGVRFLQYALPLVVLVDVVTGLLGRSLGAPWPMKRWAWLLLATAPAYPFVFTPLLGYFWLNGYVFWVCWALVPAAAGVVLNRKPGVQRNLYFLAFVLILCFWVLEFTLRRLPHAPYTHSERRTQTPYHAARFRADSAFYAPLYLQQHRINRTDSLQPIRTLEFEQVFRYNNWGFHDSHWPDSSSDSTEIWIALGDSFTEGVGAGPRGESNWPRLLQAMVRIHRPQVRILNAGISGSDPVHSLRLLERLIPRFRPKVVLLAITPSDRDDIKERGGLTRVFRPHHLKPFEYGMMTSFVFRHFFIHVLGYDYFGNSPSKQLYLERFVDQTIEDIIHNLYLMGKRELFIPKIFFLPGYHEMKDSTLTSTSFKQHKGIVNLGACYREKGMHSQTDTYFWPIDQHNTPAGYALMAECIYESLPDSLKRPLPKDRQ